MNARTIAAIAAFQRRVFNMHRPDECIQPGDCTIAALTRQTE
jgi:hypothetical protein